MGSGIAGYCVGNLNMSHHKLPWEDSTWEYPDNLAKPLTILVDASNGTYEICVYEKKKESTLKHISQQVQATTVTSSVNP